jgi:hypothetical protein
VFLHFQHHPLLRRITILENERATEAPSPAPKALSEARARVE